SAVARVMRTESQLRLTILPVNSPVRPSPELENSAAEDGATAARSGATAAAVCASRAATTCGSSAQAAPAVQIRTAAAMAPRSFCVDFIPLIPPWAARREAACDARPLTETCGRR